MTPNARLEAILAILEEIESQDRPADATTQHYFRTHRYIGSKDRREVSSMLYDCLRHKARISWWMGELAATSTQRSFLIIYLRLVNGMFAKELLNLFDGKRYSPDDLDPDEQKLLGKLKGRTLFHPDMPLIEALECPEWAFESLSKKFGGNLKGELDAMLVQAPLDLRVNSLKTTREQALKELKGKGIKVEATPYSPLGLRCRNRPSLGSLALLQEGGVEIQDEGSQLIAMLVDAKPGERVVDFCAGAGGKTLTLAASMKNKGRIVACDVMERRLKQSQKRFRKADAHNIDTKPLTSERDPWVKRQKGKFDRVLVDAPCSGVGTWRRSPNSRWDGLGPDVETLTQMQKSILESAARLVKKGGRLVYATCSMLPQENEEQVQRFLDNHPDFAVLPVQDAAPEDIELPHTGDYMALTPAQHKTDGFFAAVMVRE